MDAIYFLALTKSAFHSQDPFCIAHDAEYFMLDGTFAEGDRHTAVKCVVHRTQRKAIWADGKLCDKFSEHIGRFPVVLVEPADTDLIREGSEVRRKFFDGVMSQINSGYLVDLLAYNRYLSQRNALLKMAISSGGYDDAVLGMYDEAMIDLCERLSRQRGTFIGQFETVFQKHYHYLSEGREAVAISYETGLLENDFPTRFRLQHQADLQAQRTTLGLHRDDYGFTFDGVPVKKFGSQGQLKSFVLAMRLTQFELMEQLKGIKPILLLDDVFDKLDEKRVKRLLSLVENGFFGQVFISDARPDRSREILDGLACEKRFIEVKPAS